MPPQPKLVLHAVPFSHPCLAVSGALDRLDLEYETVELVTGKHAEEVERIYGEGRKTARVLSFGALHFRPESMGTFAGVDQLNPPGVDFAIRSVRASWRYLGITAELVHATLQALPKQLDEVDALAAAGAIGGEVPTAADFQLGSTLHLLDQIADVRPLLADRPAGTLVAAWFDKGKGDVPAGAFPPGWVPAPGQ
jgi:glutathione S-transferase